MKHLANGITIVRIILAPFLLAMRPLEAAYILIYIICGVSDILDGYVARKMHTTSKMGSKLDSIADFVMMVIVSITLYQIIEWTDFIIAWILIIGLDRIVSLVMVFIKFKELAMLHTYSNKLTGFILFITPLLIGVIRY